MAHVTASSITDEQIESLFASLPPGHDLVPATLDAVHAPVGSLRRIQARARCAEALVILHATDNEKIRRLRDQALATDDADTAHFCAIALSMSHPPGWTAVQARLRCAEILSARANTRAAKEGR